MVKKESGNMAKGMLIVMEGACDGIGKSTQYELLRDDLIKKGYPVVTHHFPSYNTFYGASVEAYLRGDFGDITDLSPYFINSLYATDRACEWYLNLKKEYDEGKIILLDRYTTSSIIYQSSLIEKETEKNKFIDYVCDYEYHKLGIPKPDMVIFLEAPFDLVTTMRTNRKNYEGNSNDIHEKNLDFMKKVYDNAMDISKYLKWSSIKCYNKKGMKSIEEIHKLVLDKVITKINK